MCIIHSKSHSSVEAKTWFNEIFQNVLSRDAQLVWLYLIACPRETNCPGLFEATILNIMEDLKFNTREITGDLDDDERLVFGFKRTKKALEEISTATRSDGSPWLYFSDKDGLILIPRRVVYNLPHNPNMIKSWGKTLRTLKPSELKKRWLLQTRRVLKKAFGRDDYRIDIYENLFRENMRGENDEFEGMDQKLSETIELDETHPETHQVTVTQTVCQTIPATVSASSNNSEDLDSKSGMEGVNNSGLSSSLGERKKRSRDERGGVGEREGNRAEHDAIGFQLTSSELPKPINPPENFTPRQKAFFEVLKRTEFFVRGRGIISAWEAIDDPARLAGILGGDSYPLARTAMIGMAGAWTVANQNQAKRNIARFIVNWINKNQERGVRQQYQEPQSQENHHEPAYYKPDLVERVKAAFNSPMVGSYEEGLARFQGMNSK